MTKRKLRVVKFPKAKVDDDTEFVQALVNLLEAVREGEIAGYAVAVLSGGRLIRAAEVIDPGEGLNLMGGIRYMQREFEDRQMAEEDEE